MPDSDEMPPDSWLGTAVPYPRDASVHRLFEEQAVATQDAIAIRSEARTLTYGELNAEATALAHLLQRNGAQPGTPIALCLDRTPQLIIAILAVLKTGAPYVPLDPAYPAERLAMMAAESGANLILTTRDLAEYLPKTSTPVLFIDEALPSPAQAGSTTDSSNLSAEVPAGAPAYIMFTSGSTGRPKGVAVPHRAIIRLVRGQDYLFLGAQETFLHFAPASFDASTLEIWAPLLNGGRLAIAPAGALSLDRIAAAIREFGVTSLWLTSGLFNLMADEQLDAFAPLRQLLAGGDVLSIPHVRKVMEAHPHLRLINGYGPTESTTFACCHTITAADLEPAATTRGIPIGQPIANTTVRILDDAQKSVPIGTPGELYIGGDGLALEYWNRPDLTEERFVTLADGERYYRTGDRVAWLPGGLIQFLGREDHQVKIRGFRIELGEIESALAHQPGVRQSVVLALGDGADKHLAAWYSGDAQPSALREALRHALPDYMVPAFFTLLESLPLTANGKIDRARLPSPAIATPLQTPATAPSSDLEKTLATLWAEILSLPAPDIHANFFDIGGTSLKLVEAHSRLVRTLRHQVPVTALFQYPTIASLAAHLGPQLSPQASQQAKPKPPPSPRIAAAAERARMQREALARKKLL